MQNSKSLKLGIYINQNSLSGGGFYESLSTIKLFNSNKFDIYYFTSNKKCKKELNKLGYFANFIPINIVDRFFLFLRRLILLEASNITPGNVTPVKLIKSVLPKNNRFEEKFIKKGINLIYFISPDVNCVYLEKLHYVITVWDLAHNNIPFFPELRENNVFETRENYYKNVLPKAYAIIVAHNLSKDLLIKKYHQDNQKVFIIPFKPSPKIIDEEEKANKITNLNFKNLPKKYLYYPAQYAAHKNHRILIEAIDFLHTKNYKDFGLVFSGADRGNLSFLKEIVKKKNLGQKVVFLPFITDQEVYSIFKNAFALVMPTFLGPGTLPTMEAMYIRVPLILPNFEFNKDYYTNSSLYYDFEDYKDLAMRLLELDNSMILRKELLNSAKLRYEFLMKSSESEKFISYLEKFTSILQSYE